jgi:hypothetical protein
VTATGGSSEFFGPYVLNVGCNSAFITYADNSGFVTSVAKSVGASTSSAYTFKLPTATQSYCSPQSTEIIKSDGTEWSGDAKLTGTGSQPKTVFDLVSTANPETISFKVKTTYPGSFTHTSATASITISCSNSYDISAAAATSP